MKKFLRAWLLLTILSSNAFGLSAAAQTSKIKITTADPEISGMKPIYLDSLVVGRVVTYSRNAEKAQQDLKTQYILSLELLLRNWPKLKGKYKNPVDIRRLSLDDLTRNKPYSVVPDSRIEVVLDDSKGDEKPPKLHLKLRIDGVHPVGTTDPYLLECQVPVHKNKWGAVDCQPVAQAR